jgi:adenine-specific DNA glycosylase
MNMAAASLRLILNLLSFLALVKTPQGPLAYAFNQPVAYVETNIRTAFIQYFFHNRTDVTDKEVLELVQLSLPTDKISYAAGTGH